eukprot:GHVT01072695.1.p1 GENE.GHVT01072695.1~~GHVT01072695.1.p1  ORF type:complete len:398 (+),score=95.22 GHVT01072695.1:649-1842(+)
MLAGLPNVGKSTIVNALRRVAVNEARHGHEGNKKITGKVPSPCRVGLLPGLTRHVGHFQISSTPPVYCVDTPGIMLPKMACPERNLKLAALGAVPDSTGDEFYVADYVLFKLNQMLQEKCQRRRHSGPKPSCSSQPFRPENGDHHKYCTSSNRNCGSSNSNSNNGSSNGSSNSDSSYGSSSSNSSNNGSSCGSSNSDSSYGSSSSNSSNNGSSCGSSKSDSSYNSISSFLSEIELASSLGSAARCEPPHALASTPSNWVAADEELVDFLTRNGRGTKGSKNLQPKENNYVEALGLDEPTNDIKHLCAHVASVLQRANRYAPPDSLAACRHFLRLFRLGRLGKVFFDQLPSREEEAAQEGRSQGQGITEPPGPYGPACYEIFQRPDFSRLRRVGVANK